MKVFSVETNWIRRGGSGWLRLFFQEKGGTPADIEDSHNFCGVSAF